MADIDVAPSGETDEELRFDVTVSEAGNDPFKGAARPRVRTTEDYLAERDAQAAKKGKKPEDFLN